MSDAVGAPGDPSLFSAQFHSRYALGPLLGRGGMGAVYRAHDRQLQRDVAIKLLLIDGHEHRARFLREAQVLAVFQHPGVVRVLTIGEDLPGPYLVMELVEGETLSAVSRERTLEDHQILQIVTDLGCTLSELHAAGIVHRDVKPDNVFLTGEPPRVLLGDFGLARWIRPGATVTSAGVVMGTPEYMAPEQLIGSELTPASDQYALAVLAYQLLTGRLPFEGRGAAAQMHERLKGDPIPVRRFRADLTRGVEGALAQGLSRDPEARFASCEGLVEAVAEALGPSREGGGAPPTREVRIVAPGANGVTSVNQRSGGPAPVPVVDPTVVSRRPGYALPATLAFIATGVLVSMFPRSKDHELRELERSQAASLAPAVATVAPPAARSRPPVDPEVLVELESWSLDPGRGIPDTFRYVLQPGSRLDGPMLDKLTAELADESLERFLRTVDAMTAGGDEVLVVSWIQMTHLFHALLAHWEAPIRKLRRGGSTGILPSDPRLKAYQSAAIQRLERFSARVKDSRATGRTHEYWRVFAQALLGFHRRLIEAGIPDPLKSGLMTREISNELVRNTRAASRMVERLDSREAAHPLVVVRIWLHHGSILDFDDELDEGLLREARRSYFTSLDNLWRVRPTVFDDGIVYTIRGVMVQRLLDGLDPGRVKDLAAVRAVLELAAEILRPITDEQWRNDGALIEKQRWLLRTWSTNAGNCGLDPARYPWMGRLAQLIGIEAEGRSTSPPASSLPPPD